MTKKDRGGKKESQKLSAASMQAAAATMAARHGPSHWQKEITPARLTSTLRTGGPLEAIVLAADIRSSTHVMKEAVDFQRFAGIVGSFTKAAGDALRERRGWYDKFTGDGFLAYWLVDTRPIGSYLGEVLGACHTFLAFFRDVVAEDLRRNSKNLPKRVGLSLGLDAGPAHLVTVSGDLTIVGAPVVGAVRMVQVASEPYETFANVYLGELLHRNRATFLTDHGIQIERACRPTKEYPDGQEVYLIQFQKPLEYEHAKESKFGKE